MPITRPLKVFLCHASADKSAVRKLYRYLRLKGMEPWLDEENILPGEDWEVEIPRALFASDVILVCISKNSINKEGYVQKEIVFALDKAVEKPEGTIFIVPAKLEECDVPKRLNRYQWVDLYHDDGRKRLMLSLNKRAAQLGPAVEQAVVSDDTEHEATEKEETELNIAEYLAVNNPVPIQKSNSTVTLHKPENKPDFWHKLAELNWITVFSILMVFFIVAIAIFNKLRISSIPIATVTTLPTLTKTLTVSPPPTETLTPESIIISTPILGIDSTIIGKDGATLVYVPAGEFKMGSLNGFPDEKPVHTVSLNAFWMGQTEVKNSTYSACVNAEICQALSRSDYYSRDASSPEYPVVFVSWNDANQYCEWAGGRLPTEAEWEFAARGTDDRVYPWGNQFECTRGNFDDETSEDSSFVPGGPNCDGYKYLAPVAKFPSGASPYNLLDMSGNVWEWVSDWYGEYKDLAVTNPTGRTTGSRRVVRGGSWLNDKEMFFRTSNRYSYPPDLADDNVGFRCVISIK